MGKVSVRVMIPRQELKQVAAMLSGEIPLKPPTQHTATWDIRMSAEYVVRPPARSESTQRDVPWAPRSQPVSDSQGVQRALVREFGVHLGPALTDRIKRCPTCLRWFADFTSNHLMRFCTGECRERWWSRPRRRDAGHGRKAGKSSATTKT